MTVVIMMGLCDPCLSTHVLLGICGFRLRVCQPGAETTGAGSATSVLPRVPYGNRLPHNPDPIQQKSLWDSPSEGRTVPRTQKNNHLDNFPV